MILDGFSSSVCGIIFHRPPKWNKINRAGRLIRSQQCGQAFEMLVVLLSAVLGPLLLMIEMVVSQNQGTPI